MSSVSMRSPCRAKRFLIQRACLRAYCRVTAFTDVTQAARMTSAGEEGETEGHARGLEEDGVPALDCCLLMGEVERGSGCGLSAEVISAPPPSKNVRYASNSLYPIACSSPLLTTLPAATSMLLLDPVESLMAPLLDVLSPSLLGSVLERVTCWWMLLLTAGALPVQLCGGLGVLLQEEIDEAPPAVLLSPPKLLAIPSLVIVVTATVGAVAEWARRK